MSHPPDQILVLGHRNPDTDASASACAYADLLRRVRRYSAPVEAAVPGPPTPQSLFVFERAGMPPPPILDDLSPRVHHVATTKCDSLYVEDRLRDAMEKLILADRSMLPVLDDQGRLHSTFSHRSDMSRFLFGLDVVPLLGSVLDWNDLVTVPGGRALGERPADPRLSGTLRVAVEGDAGWRRDLENEDILICADLSVLGELPRERRPRWVVLLSKEEPRREEVARANASGAAVMQYEHSVTDFILSLMPQVRLSALEFGTGPCVGEFDLLGDVAPIISTSRYALPVLRSDGTLVGVISRGDLRNLPRRRVILVDHFESSQAPRGMEHAEILEILDHHRVGDLETRNPVRVDCRPVGSSSTIVALNYFEAGIEPSRGVSLLLLGGLLADTLCLRGPTMTDVDRSVAARLGELAAVPVESFGIEILRAGDDLLRSDPARIWERDRKVFSIRNRTFAVAQLETVALSDLPSRMLDDFRRHVEEDFTGGAHLLSLLMLTDVLKGDSWLAACEAPEAKGVVASCFGSTEPRPGWVLARRVASRKKQVVPLILRALAAQNI